MDRTHGRVATVLLVASALAFPARVAADGGMGWPDERGDSGEAPDIIGLSVSWDADELMVRVDFADVPPLESAPDDTATDVLTVIVNEMAGGADGSVRNGFTLSVWAEEGPDRARFSAIRDGRTGPGEVGVASATFEAGSVIFRVPADRLPESSLVGIRAIATTDGGTGGVDSLPDGTGWATFAPFDQSEHKAGLTDSLLLLVGGLLVGAGPLVWVHLRARRMRLHLEREALSSQSTSGR